MRGATLFLIINIIGAIMLVSVGKALTNVFAFLLLVEGVGYYWYDRNKRMKNYT